MVPKLRKKKVIETNSSETQLLCRNFNFCWNYFIMIRHFLLKQINYCWNTRNFIIIVKHLILLLCRRCCNSLVTWYQQRVRLVKCLLWQILVSLENVLVEYHTLDHYLLNQSLWFPNLKIFISYVNTLIIPTKQIMNRLPKECICLALLIIYLGKYFSRLHFQFCNL